MNKKWLQEVSWISEDWVQRPIRGVVLSFHGLNHTALRDRPTTEELEWSRAGGLVVFPYYGPWSWMNRQARAFVDQLIDAIYEAYHLPQSVPLISTGGSMGGCSALLYTRYARRKVSACLALFPVCDVPYHFTERADLPRTFHDAFRGYPEPLEQLLTEHSPLAQIKSMPDIPYRVVHGDNDSAVNKGKHSDRFVSGMKELKRKIEYIEVPGMEHGGPFPIDVVRKNIEFVSSQFGVT